jgi:hypothetical protein
MVTYSKFVILLATSFSFPLISDFVLPFVFISIKGTGVELNEDDCIKTLSRIEKRPAHLGLAIAHHELQASSQASSLSQFC